MTSTKNSKYDLEERTTAFGVAIVIFCRSLKLDPVNSRIISQLVASAGSVGANYREANDSLGKKDFAVRLKTSRKEAKEAIHWLQMLEAAHPDQSANIQDLIRECTELRNILSAIISKFEI